MRWKAFVACPKRGCSGELEYWEGDPIERVSEEGVKFSKPTWRFVCTVCDLTGNWSAFARQYLGRPTTTWKKNR